MKELIVNLPGRTYPIYIEKGLLDRIGKELKKTYKNKKVAIITDSKVEGLYGDRIEASLIKEGFIVKKIVVDPGEKSKSFNVLQDVCERLLDFGLNREDLIITFGGGVVGDLGGFAASILLRGVPFIQIPTTLLAQIDSSIGGKVAVNSRNGKNLIGSFYQPSAVFIDPDLLHTLDDRSLYDGMGEVIKYGAIRDRELFDNLLKYETKEELFNNIEYIIYTCCNIKREIVERDEKDKGERMLLNFGHTIGHGIEKYFNYEGFTHGECVAMGMYAITKNSEALGITKTGTLEQLKQVIEKYKLPYELPSMDTDEVRKTMAMDKKNTGKHMHLIFIRDIGCGYVEKIGYSDVDKFVKLQ